MVIVTLGHCPAFRGWYEVDQGEIHTPERKGDEASAQAGHPWKTIRDADRDGSTGQKRVDLRARAMMRLLVIMRRQLHLTLSHLRSFFLFLLFVI